MADTKIGTGCPRGRGAVAGLIVVAVAAVLIGVMRAHHDGNRFGEPDAGSVDWNPQAAERELEDLQQRVEQALEKNRVGTVRRDVERFTERYPRFAPAYTLRGQVFLGLENFEGAYHQFKYSLDLDPAQGEVHLLTGSICLKLDRVDEAERHYREAMGLDQSNMEYRLHLAQCLIEQQRYHEARDELLKVLAHDSSQHSGFAMLADVYLRQNKLALAMNQITKAYENTPLTDRANQVIYIRRKALILRRQNKADEAWQTLVQLGEKERRDPQVIDEMAVCLSMQGKLKAAALLYESVLADDPANWRLAAGAARWWIKAGEKWKARLAINKIRRINSRLPVLDELDNMLKRMKDQAPSENP